MSTKAKVALGAIALVALAAVWLLLPVREWVEAFRLRLAGLGAAGVALYAALYTLATVALGPAWMLTLVAGLVWGLAGVPVALGSATLGASVAFLIGRHLARDRVAALVARDDRLRALARAVDRGGWRVVGLVRLSPLFPFGLQSYLFGVTGIPLVPYALATLAGIAPATTLYVYVGSLGTAGLGGTDGLDGGAANGPLGWALLGLGLVATALVVRLVARRAKAELAALELDAPKT